VNVLVVNAGSSSLKLSLLDGLDEVIDRQDIADWDGTTGDLSDFVGRHLNRVDAVGHRVVHGGPNFDGPVLIDQTFRRRLNDLIELAPLHQPAALAGIDAVACAGLEERPNVACFDTSFHANLPVAAATYALPAAWRAHWPIRRYGFHGLSHAYASRRAAELIGRPAEELRQVICHLGSGASLCAVHSGRSVDTTMGFTPLEGVVMATRSGSVDPGLVLWLLGPGRLTLDQVERSLERDSGLAGLCSASGGDMQRVLELRNAEDVDAGLAFDVYVHHLRGAIGAMTATLGGLDLLVFTGGVGEHSPAVRSATTAGLGHLGIALDEGRNQGATGDALIGEGTSVPAAVVAAREDLEIARQVRRVLNDRVEQEEAV